jgi:hypothetical protein
MKQGIHVHVFHAWPNPWLASQAAYCEGHFSSPILDLITFIVVELRFAQEQNQFSRLQCQLL